MRINAIDPAYTTSVGVNGVKKIKRANNTPNPEMPTGIAVISFKGGNKDQAIIYGAELRPYQQDGGVSTVLHDIRALRVSDRSPVMDDKYKTTFEFWTPKDKVVVTALYNGKRVYDHETGLMQRVEVDKIPSGLPDDSPFKKYEGKYFSTRNADYHKYANTLDFFKGEAKKLSLDGTVTILEDVTGGERKIDFGGSGDTDIKLFRAYHFDKADNTLKLTDDFQVFADVTASWDKCYQGGGYATGNGVLSQSWKGDGDARASKAFVEFMERICEIKSAEGTKFDPATVLLNDSQAAYVPEYMAEKAVKGDEFWNGKKPTLIIHNAGAGYIQATSNMNMFVNIADKELREWIEKDPEFINALKQGNEAVEKYFGDLLPNEMKDFQGVASPFRNAIYHAEQGYIPVISTVSEGYQKKTITDPYFVAGSYDKLKKLAEQNKYIGITNAFEDVNMSPFNMNGPGGYYGGKDKKTEYKFPDISESGSLKNKGMGIMKTFNPEEVNANSVNIDHVREIKQFNKKILLQRLDKDVIETLEKLKDVKGHETDMSMVIAGLPDRKVKVHGYIDKKYIDMLDKPKADLKLLVSWGRGDTQKGLDTVMEAFEAHVKAHPDENSVLVLGGELGGDAEKIKSAIDKCSKSLEGRFVFMDGFAPNKPLASAGDFAILPSRFAPCELTDLEAMKLFCPPIVTNCQGLAQKNFDATFEGEADRVTGYKTKHEYEITYEDLRELLDEKDKEALDKDVKKFKEKIINENKIKYNKTLSDKEIMDMVKSNGGFNYEYRYEVLRPYRDKLIQKELTECMERALITDRNKPIQTTMVQNHIKNATDWEHNGWLSETKKSSADLYRKYHFQSDGAKVTEQETLLYKLRENCKKAIERAKNANLAIGETGTKIETTFWGRCKKWAHSKGGKWTLGIAGGAAVISGLGYVGYKTGWLDPKFADKKKHGHLSRIC